MKTAGAVLLVIGIVTCLMVFPLDVLLSKGKLEHESNTLYYSQGVTDDLAKKTFDYLVREGIFGEKTEADIFLSKPGEKTYELRLIIEDDDVGFLQKLYLQAVAIEMAEEIFDNNILRIKVCNKYLMTKYTISG